MIEQRRGDTTARNVLNDLQLITNGDDRTSILRSFVLYETIAKCTFHIYIQIHIHILMLLDLEPPHKSWPHVEPTCCLGGPMCCLGGTHSGPT
jgi:hypothetical protein